MQGVDAHDDILVTQQVETARVVLGGSAVRVARAGAVARHDEVPRSLPRRAALLVVLREHVALLLGPLGETELEPLGDHEVEAPEVRLVRETMQRLALEVVLERVLHLAPERRIGKLEDVVSLCEARELIA